MTPVRGSTETSGGEEDAHMATMIINPDDMAAFNSKPDEALSGKEVEQDQTLVMHINSFKKAKYKKSEKSEKSESEKSE